MKLFGTIVYPKDRYLTLQFSRGGKNVMCEDYFDNMVRAHASSIFPFWVYFYGYLIILLDIFSIFYEIVITPH